MKTNMNIKVDEEVRDEAKELFGKLGLDMTTAINLFLRTSIREKGIPFPIMEKANLSNEERFDAYWAKRFARAEEQERTGQMRNFDVFTAEMERKYGLR